MGLLDKLMGKEERPGDEGPADLTGLFDQDVKDTKDSRTVNDSPGLSKAIMEYQSPNNVEKREGFTFDAEVRRTPDYYLPYYWAATYNFDKGNFEEARKALMEGIKNSKVKSVLCRRLGEFYLESGNVDDALYWFFTAAFADTGHIDYHVYLYIAYIAEVYGLKKMTSWALRRARGISYKILFEAAEYSQKKKEKIKGIAAKDKSERIEKKLVDFYRYAKPRLGEL